ncbi:DinB family protein [Flavobacterium aquiphilum]|uniref:DinB family protein n=1 Tax=Flavobacterium aquiphilum TaxID=3003261 RepID=UPI00248108F0|nr:DinB family protein [Flavobacterium aquiphilum]
MMIETLKEIFNRDLKKLKFEIESYQNEDKIWYIEKEIANSAGNLCLHLIGNLNTYIGAQIGNTNYIRNRELEFSNKNVPKSALIIQIEETIQTINNSLNLMNDEDLKKEHSFSVFESKTSKGFLLTHLTTHLAYHLGQINYHRRLLDDKTGNG